MKVAPAIPFERSAAMERLPSQCFDLLVVGGGITGAGVLLEAAARGMSCALLERGDFASGTSSKSSKLVHGGLRYLRQGEFRLVRENILERQRLLRNAAPLVEPLRFVVPIFGGGGVADRALTRGYSAALFAYDLAGGLRIGERHRRISADDVAAVLPTLSGDGLVAGFSYLDAHTDDARLTLEVVRTATLGYGAVAVNHLAVRDLLLREGRVCGVVAESADGTCLEVKARAVVNATGVFADQLSALAGGAADPLLRPAKGVHITVRREKLPCRDAALLPVRGDRRTIFVIPWGTYTYIGTTDTDYSGPLDRPGVDPEDVAYLIGALNGSLSAPLAPSDVTSSWAGLRPLLSGGEGRRKPSTRTADLSRRHRVTVGPGGLVTVTGGKLTTYRKMAEDTVDAVAGVIGQRAGRSPTRRMRLSCAEEPSGLAHLDLNGHLGPHFRHLLGRYGGHSPELMSLACEQPDLAEPLIEGLPYLRVEAVHAVLHEMAVDLSDVLERRTRAVELDAAASARAAPSVAQLIAPLLGWDKARVTAEVRAIEKVARLALAAPGALGGASIGAAAAKGAR
jgi:glycerol-3-phosphate dehydrogenase